MQVRLLPKVMISIFMKRYAVFAVYAAEGRGAALSKWAANSDLSKYEDLHSYFEELCVRVSTLNTVCEVVCSFWTKAGDMERPNNSAVGQMTNYTSKTSNRYMIWYIWWYIMYKAKWQIWLSIKLICACVLHSPFKVFLFPQCETPGRSST